MSSRHILVAFALSLSLPAVARDKQVSLPEPPAIDVSAAKERFQVLTDGKQHYVVVDPWQDNDHTYYGDGKRFYAQRVPSSSREGKESWDRTVWEPRVPALWQGGFGLNKDGSGFVQCGDRKTVLKVVEGEEREKLLAGATFYGPLWKYRAYALARDEKGTYYYVDRPREPENNKAFRLFAGRRGNLKQLKMTNVVSDSQGDIFSTKNGELRLVLDKKRSLWVAGKKETDLTSLPIEDNRIMIYTDLGVYSGQRLGTPCDDLM